jgi:hypothetical protein
VALRCRTRPATSGAVQPSSPSAGASGFLSWALRPDVLGVTLGSGRIALGATFLAGPVTAVRLLGLDTATAKRVAILSRMLAARDIALGSGALAATARRTGAGTWLLAGAGSDAADAVLLVAALRTGRVRGVAAGGLAGLAAAGALAGGFAAARSRSK